MILDGDLVYYSSHFGCAGEFQLNPRYIRIYSLECMKMVSLSVTAASASTSAVLHHHGPKTTPTNQPAANSGIKYKNFMRIFEISLVAHHCNLISLIEWGRQKEGQHLSCLWSRG